jgi:hypothetical protein
MSATHERKISDIEHIRMDREMYAQRLTRTRDPYHSEDGPVTKLPLGEGLRKILDFKLKRSLKPSVKGSAVQEGAFKYRYDPKSAEAFGDGVGVGRNAPGAASSVEFVPKTGSQRPATVGNEAPLQSPPSPPTSPPRVSQVPLADGLLSTPRA